MTLLRLSPMGLSRSHFALSPLAETVGTLITYQRAGSAAPGAYREWTAADPVAAGLFGLVATTKWFPDFVGITPTGGMDTRLDQELAEVAGFSDDDVRRTVRDTVAASAARREPDWLPSGGLAPRIAEVFDEGWRRFIRPTWSRRRAVLEREITHRAGVVATHGWQRAVTGMTRRSAWVGPDAIRFSDQGHFDREIGDQGLVFVPYTAGPGSWTCEQPPRYGLVYPARGSAVVEPTPTDPLSVLLGPGRARIVAELARPATSTQLAMGLDLSLGTVSGHLAVLRDAGVVTRSRVGRGVFYRLTERGEALLSFR